MNTQTYRKILLVGSLRSMKDGTYQSLITEWEDPSAEVEKQLCDRISDGATTLNPSSFDAIYVIIHLNDLLTNPTSSAPQAVAKFIALILSSLRPSGTLTWTTESGQDLIESSLKESSELTGIHLASVSETLQRITAIKNSTLTPPPNIKSTANAVSLNLPKKSQTKASLWSFSTNEADLIDDSTLLTEEDLQKPTLISSSEACNPKKAKKACKNCTCGLRELELMEENDLPDALKTTGLDEVPKPIDSTKLAVSGNGAKQFTSSCGSCYLGDAFRCSSCPYLGMPAFQPGQEVKLTANMGDDI